MRLRALAIAVAVALLATQARAAERAALAAIAASVDPAAERATLETLVGFGTRHTASATGSASRGIGAARQWVQSRFAAIAAACGACLTVETPSTMVSGKALPVPTEIIDVLGIQPGSPDSNRVVIISAHIDSRVSDLLNSTGDAPGANDDGSGVTAVLESARVLSHHRFRATVVYAVLSGEEQGLYGGKLLADTARKHGWQVEAQLNNDIIGNIHGQSGRIDNTHVRVFAAGGEARYEGGELDSPARNLARYMEELAAQLLTNFDVRMVYRTDRFGRGGDQVPMLEAGYPAVRITEAVENYHRQHQDLRSVDGVDYGDVIAGVDFDYLAQVTRLNAVTLAALATAPAPPSPVKIEGAVTPDTVLSWSAVPGASGYRVWWRDTLAPQWTHSRWAGNATEMTLRGVVIDDHFFGVAAVSTDDYSSPVAYPEPAGGSTR